jgi:hypothetical protein
VLRRGGNCGEAGRERARLVAFDSLSSSVVGTWEVGLAYAPPSSGCLHEQEPAAGLHDRDFVEPRCGEMEKGAGLK